ncbi:hypothetical protein Fcan01_04674 [Folsomia candida]|uniref:Uncharacterized protein n=1 Tax=Folsomia candida TaxID=158441 RepID=A0A226ER32_FOLCA|nr:hypothetical protein Fcan01_04674 [Folsomia candida]
MATIFLFAFLLISVFDIVPTSCFLYKINDLSSILEAFGSCHVFVHTIGKVNIDPNPTFPVQLMNHLAPTNCANCGKWRHNGVFPESQPILLKNHLECKLFALVSPNDEAIDTLVERLRYLRQFIVELKIFRQAVLNEPTIEWEQYNSEFYDEYEEHHQSIYFPRSYSAIFITNLEHLFNIDNPNPSIHQFFEVYHIHYVFIFQLQLQENEYELKIDEFVRYKCRPCEITTFLTTHNLQNLLVSRVVGYYKAIIDASSYQLLWRPHLSLLGLKDDLESRITTELFRSRISSGRKVFFDGLITHIIRSKTNISLLDHKHGMLFTKSQFQYYYHFTQFYRSKDNTENILVHPSLNYIYWTESSLSFVTCSTSEGRLVFNAYLSPFSFTTWTSIIITWCVLCLSLTIILYDPENEISVTKMNIISDSAWTTFATLLEIGVGLCHFMKKSGIYMTLWLLWVLLCIVLSNSYKGIVTNDVIAPLSRTPIKLIDTLIARKHDIIDSDLDEADRDEVTFEYPGYTNNQFKSRVFHILQSYLTRNIILPQLVRSNQFLAEFEANVVIYFALSCLDRNSAENASSGVMDSTCWEERQKSWWYKAFQPVLLDAQMAIKFAMTSQVFQVMKQRKCLPIEEARTVMSSCGQSAFITPTDQVGEMVDRIFGRKSSVTRQPFAILNETMAPKTAFFVVSKVGEHLVIPTIRRLLDSGIFFWWKNILEELALPKVTTADLLFTPQTLKANIGTVFIILVCSVGISTMMLWVEVSISLMYKWKDYKYRIGIYVKRIILKCNKPSLSW